MKTKIQKPGFKALLATQFLGAFNDNAFKLVISFIAIDKFIHQGNSGLFLSLSGAVFILPFLMFSTYAGFLADRFSKQKIIVGAKIAELIVMILGLGALMQGNIWPILFVLFFMGMQSAFFGPSKYGILPEILKENELSQGNGLMQMWTYAAIILGQAAGGYFVHMTSPHLYQTAFVFIGISAIGIITSLFVEKVKPSGSERPCQMNFIKEIFCNIQSIRKNQAIFLSVIGLMYFGFLSGLFQLNILLYARQTMGLNHLLASSLLAILALGIGGGSVLAGRCSDQKIELGIVPLGAMGLSIFTILLGFVYESYALVAICLFILGMSSGFYIIPLHALIQKESPKERRGQFLATSNFLTFSGIFLGFLSLYVFKDFFRLTPNHIFVFVGVLTIFSTGYICKLLPYSFARFIVWVLTHTIYKVKVINKDLVPEHGGGLIVSNHVSYVDALVLIVSMQRPVRFMVHREIYHLKILNPILRLAKAIPIAGGDKPKEMLESLENASQALKNGDLVCIFPEGHLTRTGNIHRFNKGLERIMKGVDVPIIPVYLDRLWGSIFSYDRGKYFYKIPKMIPYPVTISFGEAMPCNATAFAVRERVRELGAEAFGYRFQESQTLSEAFWKEAKRHPKRFCISDSSGRDLSYGATLISSVALSDRLKRKLGEEDNIGIMIPPSVGGVIANIAVSLLNKVPVNLNYTSSYESLCSILKQCNMKSVMTSRKFIEKTKMNVPGNLIFIEDIISKVTQWDKIKSAIKVFIFPAGFTLRRDKRCTGALATIMFTSGSTGEPKGVMLTHANIISNLEGLYQIFQLQREDKIMGILPFFHSFGFTATIWFPLVSGMGAVYHSNPLDARMIGKLSRKNKTTILMATPTFLNSYTRRCTKEDFKSLRIVIVGAEKLKNSVSSMFYEKFGIEPMEGYGCTELSPIVSINLPDVRDGVFGVKQRMHRRGKIGLPLPGIAVKILDQDTNLPKAADENGLLFVKGPNVMRGYLNKEEKTNEVIKDGWYCTGDVANIDEDGFIMITDRLSRFSKIAGEMVPHIKIEEKIHALLNSTEHICVVTSVADEKKGEKLIVLCLRDIDVPSLVDELKSSDLPNLWIPSVDNFLKVDAIPFLGTGKLDLGTIKKKARDAFSKEEK